MIIKANEAAGSPSSPALELGLFREDLEKGPFFHLTHDSAPHGAGKYVKFQKGEVSIKKAKLQGVYKRKRGSLEKNIPASPFFAIPSRLARLNEISFLRFGVTHVFGYLLRSGAKTHLLWLPNCPHRQ
jgi:hypothetical protein